MFLKEKAILMINFLKYKENKMNKLVIMFSMMLLIVTNVLANQNNTISFEEKKEKEKRDAIWKEYVDGEIKRRHEKEMEVLKIETLGRLQMLQASQTFVSQGTSFSSTANIINDSNKAKIKNK
jgi:hypothetical protein